MPYSPEEWESLTLAFTAAGVTPTEFVRLASMQAVAKVLKRQPWLKDKKGKR